jgi:uncharacterized protein (TIGR02680 family)
MTGESARTPLPLPHTRRWQPLRIGLVNVFYYDYQELWFRDGRLLLRGNNGTGKSKVLALTLPLLLDGHLSPSRVEPDADPGKRMEWNLLLGGVHEERLGYTWLELGRVTESGAPAYLAIGCGMKAVAGRGIADHWMFVTSQRIGGDLFLADRHDAPLGRERLIEAIGASGAVTQRTEQHRRNVDERLFRLGPDRYQALMQLLLQLRQPQLSKRPDEGRLSLALSEALAPVDQAVLDVIATAFHELEQQREVLAALRDTRGEVDRFQDRYRVYARVASRRQSRMLRRRHSEYETLGRDLVGVREAIETARSEKTRVEVRAEAGARELIEQRAARDELRSRAEVAQLQAAERHWRTTHDAAKRAEDQALRAAEALARHERAHERAAEDAEQTRREVLALATSSGEQARAVALEDAHAELLAPLALPDGASPAATDRAREALRGIVARRREAIDHVLALATAADRARGAATDARRILHEREASHDAASDRCQEAEARIDTAGRAHAAAWSQYAAGVRELPLPDADAWLSELSLWVETLAGESPAHLGLRRAAAAHERTLAAAHAAETAERTRVGETLGELLRERARLLAGETARPPVPYTRAEGAREARPGAPLWQVAEFREAIDPRTRAGLEAALEASGLLDAWLMPDGRLLDRETHDVIVTPVTPVTPGASGSGSRSLASALAPALDAADPQAAALSEDAVLAVLASIGYGAQTAAAWVDADGSFAVGPLRGSFAKPDAEYVGRGAREAARRRRLAQLAGEIESAERGLAAAEAAVAAVEARQRALAAELSRPPSEDALRSAHSECAAAARELERCRSLVETQGLVVARAEDAAAEAEQLRDATAADLRVPAIEPGLRALRDALDAYSRALTELLSEVRVHARGIQALREAEAAHGEAVQALDQVREGARAADEALRDAKSRYEALREAIGSTVEEIHARLRDIDHRIRDLEAESKVLAERRERATLALGQAEGKAAQLGERQREAGALRDDAVRDLARFAETGLLHVAVPDAEPPMGGVSSPDAPPPWAAEPAVRLARHVEQALGEVEDGDEAWQRLRDDVQRRYTELGAGLSRHGHMAQLHQGDWLLVTIRIGGRDLSPGAVVRELDDDIAHRERILSAKERDVLEEHLVSDVAAHLQELISAAEVQVEQMNAELAERPTSTGMRLRLRWVPRADGPAGLPEARTRLLRQTADLWSADDRAAVGEFLQRQIEAARAADEHATWHDHLARALDYRAWHHFVIERHQDGKWRPATGPASGGERVLTVSLPLFAAASAHYRSADPHAPRLVMLDEAFAGVDDDSRAKCLGLLASFDLDVVMTSEREWGFYATVPGIATHQLVRREGIDAVHVTTWEWDGRAREQVERVFAGRPSDGVGGPDERGHARDAGDARSVAGAPS